MLASSGDVFQYMERVRSSEAATAADGKAGATSERFEEHTLENYPPGLHKKVTLLQHFRDYLLQQQKEKTEKDAATAAAAAAASSSSNQGGGDSTSRGPPKEPRAAWGEQQQLGASSSSAGGSGLAFVKKWVRTRHAILFRLSNGTVQVMFLDNTEVLLAAGNNSDLTATGTSSGGYGGGCVTFADKQGSRRSMSLSDVVANPRSDVTKRLKYTKDILRQLISSGKK